MIKCNKSIIDKFESNISEIKTGYNENGAVSIRQLEAINHAISQTGLEKHRKSKATLRQNGYEKGGNCVLTCTNGKLDINSAALYYCAFYIKSGLHPVLIYSTEHVFVGVWINKDRFFDISQDDSNVSLVKDSLYPQNGDLLLIDSWDAINSDYNFWNGLRSCEEKLLSIKKVLDFNSLNKADNNCIILDDFPYRSSEQTRECITTIISDMNFLSEKPTRNFRNVHFCNISEYDMSVSDMIQQINPYFIKNIPPDKQAAIAADAAMNMGCQGKNILLVCDENGLDSISGNIYNTGVNLNPDFISVIEDADYFDMDDENAWQVLRNMFFSKRNDTPNEEQAAYIAEQIDKFKDKEFTKQDIEEFYKLADKKKKLCTIPKGSTKTLLEIWKEYSENNLQKVPNNTKNNDLRQDIENAVFANFTNHNEILENIKKFAELRKKCIFKFEDGTFDVTDFNNNAHDISKFKNDIEKIYTNHKNLDSVYERIAGNNENIFSFEEMMEYKTAFEILLELKAPDIKAIDYSKYTTYIEYDKQKTYFSGGDADLYLDEYTSEELECLIKDIENIISMPSHRLSQDYKTSKDNVYGILKKIISADDIKLFSFFFVPINHRKKNDILSSFKKLISLRKEIHEDISVLRDIHEIFTASVNPNTFPRQYAWLEHHINIGKNSAVAEQIAKDCCLNDNNEIKSYMLQYLKDNGRKLNINPSFIKYIGEIRDFLNLNIYYDYLDAKNTVIGFGLGKYTEQTDECCSKDRIDDISSLAEKYLLNAVYLKLLNDSGVNIQDIPFTNQLYKRKLDDLKKHYSYLITHEKPSQPRIVACTPDKLEQYKDNTFDKMIICATEKIPYSPVEWAVERIGSITFMSESDDFSECPEGTVATLMNKNLNSFDYSEYNMEEN